MLFLWLLQVDRKAPYFRGGGLKMTPSSFSLLLGRMGQNEFLKIENGVAIRTRAVARSRWWRGGGYSTSGILNKSQHRPTDGTDAV